TRGAALRHRRPLSRRHLRALCSERHPRLRRDRKHRVSSAAVRILLWNELRMLLRDRRTVVLSVALPLLAMPLMLYSIKFITAKRRQNLEAITYRYVLTGSEAARARAVIEAGRREVEREPAGEEKSALLRFTAKEVEASDPAASVKQRKIHFYVE